MRKTLLTAAIAVVCLVATMTGADADWRRGHHGYHGYHGYHHSQPWGHRSHSSHQWRH